MAKMKPLTGNFGDFSGIVLKAAARGDIPAVKHYLERQPRWLNQVGPHGRTMLWEAAYKGRTEMVEYLLQRGASVDALGSYYTPMRVELSPWAVAQLAGRQAIVELLESHGATDDIYAATHRGDLPAMQQFIADDPQSIHRPAREYPDDQPPRRMGWHAVHYAVVGQQLAALRLLVEHGASIGQHLELLVDWADGESAITKYVIEQAAREGVEWVDEDTVSDVPSVDRPDQLGYPPLVDACRGNHNAQDVPERVQELLDQGATVNITDYKGKTALHRAGQAGFVKITRLLLENEADVTIADAKGATPIFDAVYYGKCEVVKLLVEHGADLEHADPRGETPLFVAARRGNPEMVGLLLSLGANPLHTNKKGQVAADVVKRRMDDRDGLVAILS